MEMSFYNIYLLINKDGGVNFGILGLQTDNILNIGIEVFMNKKEVEITETKFKTKSQTILETGISRVFNGCHMIIRLEFIMVIQKNQADKLVLVNIKDNTKKQ